MNAQSFLHPSELFADHPAAEPRRWLCVRTRPRAEKQFSGWLTAHSIDHYLPTARQARTCGRKRYMIDAPLFSGYVFVVGDYDKSSLKDARCIVDLLRPKPGQLDRLERDLWSIWRGLVTGSRLELYRKLAPGDLVEVTTEPFVGMQGRFEKWGKGGRLHIWLDMLGCGVSVCLPELFVVRSLASPSLDQRKRQ